MPTQHTKNIGQQSVNKMQNRTNTWTVMRPFVLFSINAVRVIAHTLIFIVKSIPKAANHKQVEKKMGK